jgi:hypothetical protein
MGNRERLDIKPLPELRQAIDRWRAGQPGVPSRAAAARMILEQALGVGAVKPPVKRPPKRKAPK